MKKTSKTGIILIASALVCVILALAVGIPNGFFGDGGKGGDLDDENTPKIEDIMEGGTPLLVFDKSEDAVLLMEAFDRGEIVAVRLLYDNGEEKTGSSGADSEAPEDEYKDDIEEQGSSPEMESDDQAVIKEAYKGLKNIVVGNAVSVSAADSYNYVKFELKDGSEIAYSFEDDNLLCYGGSASADGGSYEIEGTEQLWDVYRLLAREKQ